MFGKSSKVFFSLVRYFLLFLIISVITYQVFNNYQITLPVNQTIRTFFFNGNFTKNHVVPSSDESIISNEPIILRNLVVRTKLGRLRGFVQNVSGVEIQTFLSVPYGQPPVDKLRFRKTKPVKKWSGIRDATKIPPPCVQPEYYQQLFPVHILNNNITEDCLFLNIWSPVGSRNKTVMVFIHGGLFTIGSIGIDEYDGRMLAAYGDVTVVTIQYRLGIFGFLDLDTERIPGNMGLFDQYMALKWVQDNIKYFGGNPDLVTLFGTSAGSISVGFHIFSPLAQGLFKRAILQSGSPMLIKDAFTLSEKIAEKFTILIGCFEKNNGSIYDDPEPIVDCIDQKSFDQLYKAQSDLIKSSSFPFMPSIPSQYIENLINDYNESTKIMQKEVLMGFNLNEGALILHLAYPTIYTRNQVPPYVHIKDVQNNVIKIGVNFGLKEGAASAIVNTLIRGENVDTPIRWAQKFSDLLSDVMFICPTYQFINKLISMNTTTYLYMFAQRSQNTEWGEWMQVTHHDEINFIMGYPLRYPQLYSENDIEISFKMIKTWTHFAQTGKILQKFYPEIWKPCSMEEKYFMQIKANDLKLGSNFHNESCELYNLFLDYMN